MADNTTINPGVGGDTLRTDDVSGVKVPVSKIITGGDGVDGGFVGVTNPLPVLLCSGSDTIGTSTNPIRTSGSVGVLVGGQPVSLSNPLAVQSRYEPAGAILSGSTVRQVNHATFDASSGSANQVVAPQGANNRIALLSAQVMSSQATSLRWISTGSAGSVTNIGGIALVPANGGYVLPHNPHGWVKTVANEGLNIAVGATSTVGITITWAIFNNP